MAKQKLTDNEIKDAQNTQLIFMDFMSRNAKNILDERADDMPAPFFYNEGLKDNMVATMEQSDYDYKTIDENLPFGRMFTNLAVNDVFHVDKLQAQYMGLEFVRQFVGPEYNQTVPAQTELFKQKNEATVLSIVHRIREAENKPFEWALSSMKYHKEKNTIIGFITPFRMLSEVGHKFNRLMDEHTFMKSNIKKYTLLTPREREIVALLAHGLSNPQIAEQLFISRQTVEQHRKNINKKLETQSFADLIRFALAFDML